MLKFGIGILAFIVFIGCQTSKDAVETGSTVGITKIVHGTSFGHCRGYCIKEEAYTSSELISTQINRDSINFPKKQVKQSYTIDEFNTLVASFSMKKWEALEEVIGCPDCADRGAEYIIITSDKGTKKVMFDAYTEVDGLQVLLGLLRDKRKVMEKKANQETE